MPKLDIWNSGIIYLFVWRLSLLLLLISGATFIISWRHLAFQKMLLKQCPHNGQTDSHHFQCTRTNVLGHERSFTDIRSKCGFVVTQTGSRSVSLPSTVHASLTLESFLGHTRQMTLHTSLFLYICHIGQTWTLFS